LKRVGERGWQGASNGEYCQRGARDVSGNAGPPSFLGNDEAIVEL